MIDLDIIGLISTALFSGYLLSGLLLLPPLLRNLSAEHILMELVPGFLRTGVILGILSGLLNALSSHSNAAFLLAIIAMSLILSRTHLLRMVLTSYSEGQAGDAGAMRMYRLGLLLLMGLYVTQFCASVAALYLLALN
ncbi:MAG: hypothetical protein R3312_10225 [Gammaproteobacteria bacterium]|nr:hypothetical protein [Gammaproteobacteria bacterium]